MRSTSFGSTATGTASAVVPPDFAPYTTPGIRPATRRRRASFFPLVSRFNASSVAYTAYVLAGPALRGPAYLLAGAEAPAYFTAGSKGTRPTSHEQRRDRRLLVDVPDGLAQEPRHRQHFNLPALLRGATQRHRVGDDQVIERRLLDPLDRRPRQHSMHRAREHTLRAGLFQRHRRLLNRPRGVDDVVLQDARAPGDVTDHVHHFRRPVVGTPLVDDGQLGVQALRIGAGALGATGIRRDDGQIRVMQPRAVVDNHRRRKEVIDGNIKEPLDL